ncbi:hypothetical protein CC80DRAFT_545388 [Byssothecium circinans]|uniref:DUF7730 domain-containing protein n=1 Tax=Byssothecium circinans TaxID=147558 RepID=A0A6A5U5L1_9PLEO|nr:hypothetical protein CC80DRAFT_545388 [Byssothecium circinans]
MTSNPPFPSLFCLVPALLFYIPERTFESWVLNVWNVRPPHARKRKRRLTLPFNEPQEQGNAIGYRAKLRERVNKPHTEQQAGVGFFALPLEVREMIYCEYVGSGNIWVILLQSGRIHGFEDLGDHSDDAGRRRVDLLPLLLACRRTYSELIRLIYTLPNFTFLDPFSFFAFSAMLIPSRFHNIRRVNIDLLALPPGDLIPRERHSHLNEMLYDSFKIVRRTHLRIHNKLPREVSSKEKRKMLWHKILDVTECMEGLQRLEVSAGPPTFGKFYPSMTATNETRRNQMRLQELLVLGVKRNANIALDGAKRDSNGDLSWYSVQKSHWAVDLEMIESWEWQKRWHDKIMEHGPQFWKVSLHFDRARTE